MALWVKLKQSKNVNQAAPSAQYLAEKCHQMSIYVQHEKQFQLNKNNEGDNYIRLGFAGMSEGKFADGIELLANSLHIKN